MKGLRRVRTFFITISVSGVCLLFIAPTVIEKLSSINNRDVYTNQRFDSVDVPGLKKFEQEIRGKFASFNPDLSVLEKQRHSICINNLNENRREDMIRYQRNNAEPMRHSHLSYLKPESVVIEIGGNRGHDTGKMVDLYDPFIITLEPVESMANTLKEKFKDNEKVTVLNFGLGKVIGEVFVDLKGDLGEGTSAFAKNAGNTSLILANTTEILLRIGAGKFDIDLFLLNCEGCEFEVLEAIISSGLVTKFKNIQFQAHDLPDIRDHDNRYCQIEALLNRTHSPTYRYRYVWEHWRRNDIKLK